ncbi:hypothetical protein CMALT430_100029 [Carnobacterium maltaromaticum]|nr:hypothetical protein CMALT430_100029 [Carnobacterium maltaromaticum]
MHFLYVQKPYSYALNEQKIEFSIKSTKESLLNLIYVTSL